MRTEGCRHCYKACSHFKAKKFKKFVNLCPIWVGGMRLINILTVEIRNFRRRLNMKKRLVPFVLAICVLLLGMLPASAFAAAPEGGVSPRASVAMSGGLIYNTTEQAYYIVGECFGAEEYKTLVIALYKKSGTDWQFVDSQIACGTATYLSAEKKVEITSGYYKLVVSTTSPTHSGSVPYYYNV